MIFYSFTKPLQGLLFEKMRDIMIALVPFPIERSMLGKVKSGNEEKMHGRPTMMYAQALIFICILKYTVRVEHF